MGSPEKEAASKRWNDLSMAERVAVIWSPDGLNSLRTSRKKTVAVLGAGMAGLVAAHELHKAGHDVTILEAQERVGGRIRTLRDPFAHGLYADAGAMRIPETHELTMAYVRSAPTRDVEPLETRPFKMKCDNAYIFMHNRRRTWKEYNENPATSFELDLEPHETSLPIQKLFENTVLAPLWEKVGMDPTETDKLNDLMETLEKFSTRRYLEEQKNWSFRAVDAFGLLENQQARLNNGVTALLREYLLRSFGELVQIAGGMELLPQSFLPALANRIQFGATVEGIKKRECEDSLDSATIRYSRVCGKSEILRKEYAVVTLPFPLLRHIDGLDSFSRPKQRAIQGLNYSAAGKIFLQCARPFWEFDEHGVPTGIDGGRTQTDLGLRSIWYPTKREEQQTGRKDERCILLASYTWGRDAQRWAHLSPKDRVRTAVKELARIHPVLKDQPELIEGGTSIMWQNEEFAGGAFALTNPEQASLHDDNCRAPEGRFHFAGEHTSLNYHRWIEGAVESGLRAAYEIHCAAGPTT